MIYRHPESFHVPFQDLLFSTTSTTMIGTNLHPVQLALETLCVNHLPKVVAKPTVTWSNRRKTKRQLQLEQDEDHLNGEYFDSNIIEETSVRKRQKSSHRETPEALNTNNNNNNENSHNDYEEESSTASEINDDEIEDDEEQVINFGNY